MRCEGALYRVQKQLAKGEVGEKQAKGLKRCQRQTDKDKKQCGWVRNTYSLKSTVGHL